jgi:hypothetical protein
MEKWNRFLNQLNSFMAEFYPNPSSGRVQRMLRSVGIPLKRINFGQGADDVWYEVVDEARKLQLEIDLIRAVREDYGDDEQLREIENGLASLTRPKGAPTVSDADFIPRDSAIETLEKIIGTQNTLLPISFLEIGLIRARSVARIKRADGKSGTGFLVGEDLLLTNNHVLPSRDEARVAVAQFNYQRDPNGLDVLPVEYALDPDIEYGFATSEEDDWAAVRVHGDLSAWGKINLDAAKSVNVNEHVNIIQHPAGGPKQIGLYHNVVAHADERVIQYLTDTMPGSSGSPVFNSQWEIVALHHAGGNLFDPDKKQFFFRNEGINIERVLVGLRKQNMLH